MKALAMCEQNSTDIPTACKRRSKNKQTINESKCLNNPQTHEKGIEFKHRKIAFVMVFVYPEPSGLSQ